jgi:hypothetical protein
MLFWRDVSVDWESEIPCYTEVTRNMLDRSLKGLSIRF